MNRSTETSKKPDTTAHRWRRDSKAVALKGLEAPRQTEQRRHSHSNTAQSAKLTRKQEAQGARRGWLSVCRRAQLNEGRGLRLCEKHDPLPERSWQCTKGTSKVTVLINTSTYMKASCFIT